MRPPAPLATKATNARHADSHTRGAIVKVREALAAAVSLLDKKPAPRHWWYELGDQQRLVCLDRLTLMCRALLNAAAQAHDPGMMRSMRALVRVALAEQERAVFDGFEQCDDRPIARLNADVAEEFGEAVAALAHLAADPSPSNRETAKREVAEAVELGTPVLRQLVAS